MLMDKRQFVRYKVKKTSLLNTTWIILLYISMFQQLSYSVGSIGVETTDALPPTQLEENSKHKPVEVKTHVVVEDDKNTVKVKDNLTNSSQEKPKIVEVTVDVDGSFHGIKATSTSDWKASARAFCVARGLETEEASTSDQQCTHAVVSRIESLFENGKANNWGSTRIVSPKVNSDVILESTITPLFGITSTYETNQCVPFHDYVPVKLELQLESKLQGNVPSELKLCHLISPDDVKPSTLTLINKTGDEKLTEKHNPKVGSFCQNLATMPLLLNSNDTKSQPEVAIGLDTKTKAWVAAQRVSSGSLVNSNEEKKQLKMVLNIWLELDGVGRLIGSSSSVKFSLVLPVQEEKTNGIPPPLKGVSGITVPLQRNDVSRISSSVNSALQNVVSHLFRRFRHGGGGALFGYEWSHSNMNWGPEGGCINVQDLDEMKNRERDSLHTGLGLPPPLGGNTRNESSLGETSNSISNCINRQLGALTALARYCSETGDMTLQPLLRSALAQLSSGQPLSALGAVSTVVKRTESEMDTTDLSENKKGKPIAEVIASRRHPDQDEWGVDTPTFTTNAIILAAIYQQATGDTQFLEQLQRWLAGLQLFYRDSLWQRLPFHGNGMVWVTLSLIEELKESLGIRLMKGWDEYVEKFDVMMTQSSYSSGKWSFHALKAAASRLRYFDTLLEAFQTKQDKGNIDNNIETNNATNENNAAFRLPNIKQKRQYIFKFLQDSVVGFVRGLHPHLQPDESGMLHQTTCGLPLNGALAASYYLHDDSLRGYLLRHLEKDIKTYQISPLMGLDVGSTRSDEDRKSFKKKESQKNDLTISKRVDNSWALTLFRHIVAPLSALSTSTNENLSRKLQGGFVSASVDTLVKWKRLQKLHAHMEQASEKRISMQRQSESSKAKSESSSQSTSNIASTAALESEQTARDMRHRLLLIRGYPSVARIDDSTLCLESLLDGRKLLETMEGSEKYIVVSNNDNNNNNNNNSFTSKRFVDTNDASNTEEIDFKERHSVYSASTGI